MGEGEIMVDVGFASKYSSVGWKGTIPTTSDTVDMVCCVGDAVVFFVYDEVKKAFVCKAGMAKKPSSVWAAMPDGGAFTAHVPNICFNDLYGCALRLRYVSGSTYYPWLMQSGQSRAVIESVLSTSIGASDPYVGYAVRLFDANSLTPATYSYIYYDLNVVTAADTAYKITMTASREIIVATSDTRVHTISATGEKDYPISYRDTISARHVGTRYPGFSSGTTVLNLLNTIIGSIKYPDDPLYSDGSRNIVKFAWAVSFSLGETIVDTYPVDPATTTTTWTTRNLIEAEIEGCELRLYNGDAYQVIESYPIYNSSDPKLIYISGDLKSADSDVAVYASIAKSGSIYFETFGPYVFLKWQAPSYTYNGFISLSGRSGGHIYSGWYWDSGWKYTTDTSYANGIDCVLHPTGVATNSYRRLLYDFKNAEVVAFQTSTLSTFADCDAIPAPPTWVYFPYYGIGVATGTSLILCKDALWSASTEFNLGDTLIWNMPQYVKYTDPSDGLTKHRYSLKAQGSIINITFDEAFTSATMEKKPFYVEYSDGTIDAMSRVWTAVGDISGGGMFSVDLMTAGATILDMY